jgi:LuxR family maltose regulon positive regulatory protein
VKWARQVTTDHILFTKLVIPVRPAQMVARARLVLPDSAPRIVLVCAPAGYGKTTLISSWAAAAHMPPAWLSLDAGDNDPIRFVNHFIAAIQVHHAEFGKIVGDMLGCVPPPPVAGLMRSLVNQICSLPHQLCMILDDLHLITNSDVHEAISFLVDHQPPQLRLIIASRCDPPFSLARLRGQRQVLEFRASDLRFTLQEAHTFCNDVMRFSLLGSDVAALTARTEGWIVGLQLAAMSLIGAPDKTAFIKTFSGDNRHITDFLLDEVMRTHSEEIQNFLLQTSLLERFNAPLCDAVMVRTDSRKLIDEIERANMFIVSLDHQRVWYRYHHLFTSLLQSRLQQSQPDLVKDVHRRASMWFAENKLITEAIDHAIKAMDFSAAAELMEKHGGNLFSHGRISTVLAWSEKLPPAVLAQRPVLSIMCAWANFYADNLSALERHIRTAALCLPNAQSAPYGSADRTMFGQLAIMRGCHHCYTGNLVSATEQFKEALQSIPPERTLYRAAAVCLGTCYFVARKLDDAQQLLEEHANITEVKYNLMVPITAVLALAHLHIVRGDLISAKQVYNKAMRECQDAGWHDFPACGILHIGLGELAYEENDLALAERHTVRGIEMTSVGMGCHNAWGHALLALIRHAQGVTENLLSIESEAHVMKYSGRFLVDVPPVSAAAGNLWILQNRMDAAAQWVANARLPLTAELAAGREAEYLVLVRYWIRLEKVDLARELLKKLWATAQERTLISVMAEILILQAIVHQSQADTIAALDALRQAIELAKSTNFVRLFLNDSAAIANLLIQITRDPNCPAHVSFLLKQMAIDTRNVKTEKNDVLSSLFSKKEMQVAAHIVSGQTNQEIAKVMFISPNTLNSHMKNIYSKLGVNSRVQAVDRLRRLGYF